MYATLKAEDIENISIETKCVLVLVPVREELRKRETEGDCICAFVPVS